MCVQNLSYKENVLTKTPQVGGTYLKPLLLPPEVAIGGLGKIQVRMCLVVVVHVFMMVYVLCGVCVLLDLCGYALKISDVISCVKIRVIQMWPFEYPANPILPHIWQVLPRFDENGNVAKAHVIRVNWSADHRVIDGATVARFSNVWKSFVNNPATMIVNMA